MTTNEIIKEMRLKYKLTQKQLAEITSIPKRTIENWDANKAKPSDYMPNLIEARLKEYFKNNEENL